MNRRWLVYKPLRSNRWIVWNRVTHRPLAFDTWQQAMDYVNGRSSHE